MVTSLGCVCANVVMHWVGFIPHRAAGNEIIFASLLDTTVSRGQL